MCSASYLRTPGSASGAPCRLDGGKTLKRQLTADISSYGCKDIKRRVFLCVRGRRRGVGVLCPFFRESGMTCHEFSFTISDSLSNTQSPFPPNHHHHDDNTTWPISFSYDLPHKIRNIPPAHLILLLILSTDRFYTFDDISLLFLKNFTLISKGETGTQGKGGERGGEERGASKRETGRHGSDAELSVAGRRGVSRERKSRGGIM